MITVNPKRQVRTISPVAQCDPIIVNPVLTLSTYVKTFYFILGYAAVWKVIFLFLCTRACLVCGAWCAQLKGKLWYCWKRQDRAGAVVQCNNNSFSLSKELKESVCTVPGFKQSVLVYLHLQASYQVISVESVHCYDFPLGRERQWWCKKRQHWWLSINTRHPHQFSSLTQVRSAEASHKGKISSSPEVNE